MQENKKDEKTMKSLIKISNQKTYPVLNTILVKNGIAYATNMDSTFSYPCEQADSLYDAKLVKAGIWQKSGIDQSEFPIIEGNFDESNMITVNFKDLAFVAPAMSKDKTGYYLSGIFFDKFGMVATDGKRLHRVKFDNQDIKATIPGTTIELLLFHFGKKHPEKVNITFSETRAQIMAGDLIIVTKLVDGTFPDYQGVIPDHNKKCKIDIKEIAKHKKEILAFLDSKFKTVVLSKNRITVNNSEYGTKSWDIKTLDEFDALISFNYSYLLNMPSGSIAYGDKSSPIVITDGNRQGVLAPMRI